MKYLAIDYGRRRIGLAISDESGWFASPFATREHDETRKALATVVAEMIETIRQQNIETIVIGLPRATSGEVSEMETTVRAFRERLERALATAELSLSIHWWDERFSTSQVLKNLRSSGVSTKKAKAATGNESIDARAAAIILQDFLDAQKIREDRENEDAA